jgi:hypothetical protein
MDAFSRIANKLDVNYEKSIPELDPLKQAEQQISVINEDRMGLTSAVNQAINLPQVTIKDQQYLEDKTKQLIERSEKVLSVIETAINNKENTEFTPFLKIQAWNSYATVSNAISIQIRELRELNKMIMGMNVINNEAMIGELNKGNESKKKESNYTSAEVLKLVKTLIEKKDNDKPVNAEYEEVGYG